MGQTSERLCYYKDLQYFVMSFVNLYGRKIPPALGPISYNVKHSPYGLVLIQDKSWGFALGSIHNRNKHCRYQWI